MHVVGTEPRLAGWGPSLSSIDVPNLTAVVAASQGCMVQYFMKRGTDVIGVHDALKARTGTFIFTGLWEGKKKCAVASCWSLYSFYSAPVQPSQSSPPQTHQPIGKVGHAAVWFARPRLWADHGGGCLQLGDRTESFNLNSGCSFRPGVLPRRFARRRGPRAAPEHAIVGLHLLALQVQGVRDRDDHGPSPGTDLRLGPS